MKLLRTVSLFAALSAVACNATHVATATGAGLAAWIATLHERDVLTDAEAAQMQASVTEILDAQGSSLTHEQLGIGAAGILGAAIEVWRRRRKAAISSRLPASAPAAAQAARSATLQRSAPASQSAATPT